MCPCSSPSVNEESDRARGLPKESEKKDSIEIGSIINRGPWVRTTVRIVLRSIMRSKKALNFMQTGEKNKQCRSTRDFYGRCTERKVFVHYYLFVFGARNRDSVFCDVAVCRLND